jgi:hypothetical protein
MSQTKIVIYVNKCLVFIYCLSLVNLNTRYIYIYIYIKTIIFTKCTKALSNKHPYIHP